MTTTMPATLRRKIATTTPTATQKSTRTRRPSSCRTCRPPSAPPRVAWTRMPPSRCPTVSTTSSQGCSEAPTTRRAPWRSTCPSRTAPPRRSARACASSARTRTLTRRSLRIAPLTKTVSSRRCLLRTSRGTSPRSPTRSARTACGSLSHAGRRRRCSGATPPSAAATPRCPRRRHPPRRKRTLATRTRWCPSSTPRGPASASSRGRATSARSTKPPCAACPLPPTPTAKIRGRR
mmetsp:Transcript_33807/g.104375  ORF Transcript_33807/g.104375 Transcript_33807/m.104375 type:complete len:235 (-) Transcript_33807:701-1405(-)